MQELLYASSALITDYSSCIWDASLTYKPCFIYAPDLDDYLADRNFYTPVSEWPFPMARDIDALEEIIRDFDEEHYKKEADRHHAELGSDPNSRYTDAKASSVMILSGGSVWNYVSRAERHTALTYHGFQYTAHGEVYI